MVHYDDKAGLLKGHIEHPLTQTNSMSLNKELLIYIVCKAQNILPM